MSELINMREPDYSELKHKIFNYNNNPIVQKLKRIYYLKSFPEILGVSRREISHSSFLAWLFNYKESHGLKDQALIKLLALLSVKVTSPTDTLYELFCIGNYTISSENVYTEVTCKQKGRIDILIELSIYDNNNSPRYVRLIIENKVSSTEHHHQTQNYYDYFSHLEDKYTNIFVYLTTLSPLKLKNLQEPQCSCKKYIQINYQDIVNYVINPIIEIGNLSSRTKFILEEYITSLEQPALNPHDSDTLQKADYIMAMSNEQRNLLILFWKENEILIKSAVEALLQDDGLDEESRKSVKQMQEALQKFKRDFTQYKFGNKTLTKNKLVWEVIQTLIAQNPTITSKEIKTQFSWENNTALTSIDKDKIDSNVWFSEPLKLADGEFMLRQNIWGKGVPQWESFYSAAKKLKSIPEIIEVKKE